MTIPIDGTDRQKVDDQGLSAGAAGPDLRHPLGDLVKPLLRIGLAKRFRDVDHLGGARIIG